MLVGNISNSTSYLNVYGILWEVLFMYISWLKKKTISISLKHFFKKKSCEKKPESLPKDTSEYMQDIELMEAINQAKLELDIANEKFEYATTPEIIDSHIYKLKGCTEYYQYLIKLAKQRGIMGSITPQSIKEKNKKKGGQKDQVLGYLLI